MYADISQPPKPLPLPNLQEISSGLRLLPPLTRGGEAGPGVIILVPEGTPSVKIEDGVPSLSLKWAEEGYAVAEVQAASIAKEGTSSLQQAIQALKSCAECFSAEKVGLIAYDCSLWEAVSSTISEVPQIVAAVIYTDQDNVTPSQVSVPTLLHIAGKSEGAVASPSPPSKTYQYPTVSSARFATPFTKEFHYNTEAISHTRNLTFLKPKVDGPYYDLEAIWGEHCFYEFADRSVQHTMSTMVQEPYVNHLPTMTGGVGRAPLTEFYREDFIFSNTADTELELISRTIGIDRIVDEFIFKYTHSQEIPWMLPGVPPTGKRVETPFTAVVNIRGDRLYHEHIAWDQASVLRQLGLLPDYLPFPYPLPNGETEKNVEYRLPVAGTDVTTKMRDRNSLPSNQMLDYKYRLTEVEVNGTAALVGDLNLEDRSSAKSTDQKWSSSNIQELPKQTSR